MKNNVLTLFTGLFCAALTGLSCCAQAHDPKAVDYTEMQHLDEPQPRNVIKGLVFVPYEHFTTIEAAYDLYNHRHKDLGDSIVAGGFSYLSESDIQNTAAPFLGTKLNIDNLNQVIEAIKPIVRKSNQPFASIYIPEQDVTNGVVVFIIRQALLENLTVSGNKYFTTPQIMSQIHQHVGDPVYRDELEDDLAWLNLSPNRRVNANFQPGQAENTTSVNLDVQETKPWHVFISRSNDGAASLDKQQYALGFIDNNLWNADHKISYQYGFSQDHGRMEGHNGFYEFPLPWRNLISLNASYDKAKAPLLDGAFESNGTFRQYGGRYEIPLYNSQVSAGWQLQNQKLSFGADYKRSQGNVLFTLFGDPISAGIDSDVEVVDPIVSYETIVSDPFQGQTSILTSVIYSPGDLTTMNSDKDFAAAREGANAEYAYSRFLIGRTMPLPFTVKFGPPILSTRIEGQISNDRLIGSERLVGGARPGFRGYSSDAFSGDYGYGASIDLTSSPIEIFKTKNVDGEFQFGVFTDFGTLRNISAVGPAEEPIDFWSTGVSFSVQANDNLSMSLIFSKDLSAQSNDNVQNGMFRLILSY